MRNILDDSGDNAAQTAGSNGPTVSESLRRRTGKMVPRISTEAPGITEHAHNLSSNENIHLGDSSKYPNRGANGDIIFDSPSVRIEDPLKERSKRAAQTCETSFTFTDSVCLDDKKNDFNSPTNYLSPTGDISISSDDDGDAVAIEGAFNSRNLYRPTILSEDFDETTEETVLLPDGELRRIRQGDKEIDIKISSEEKSLTIGLQVFFPFMIAGLGTVGAGLLLDVVQVTMIIIIIIVTLIMMIIILIEHRRDTKSYIRTYSHMYMVIHR